LAYGWQELVHDNLWCRMASTIQISQTLLFCY
jgi:hypothetical protein